jgi:hypothetical protein
MDNRNLWIYSIVLILILIPFRSNADVPMLINYRGYVDVSDPAIGLPTGALSVDLTFSLFDTIQIAGVTPLWTETQTVQLLDGNFAVMLGSVAPLSLDREFSALPRCQHGISRNCQPPVDPERSLRPAGGKRVLG